MSIIDPDYPRDLIGYGASPPAADWPCSSSSIMKRAARTVSCMVMPPPRHSWSGSVGGSTLLDIGVIGIRTGTSNGKTSGCLDWRMTQAVCLNE